MANWPLPLDYQKMLQRPGNAFKADELKACTIQLDINRMPYGRSGNYATVYQGTLASGQKECLRVFTRTPDGDCQARYQAISDHFDRLRAVGRLPSAIVGFRYDAKGIRVANDKGQLGWYPLVRMDWVDGTTLQGHLIDVCGRGDARTVQTLADKWVELMAQVADPQILILHGDLQHGNIMVTDRGELKLVDYDSMAVPGITHLPCVGQGLPSYQHPKRGECTSMIPQIDNYSALVIFASLRALAADVGLWTEFVHPPAGAGREPVSDKTMLLQVEDLDQPAASHLIRKLRSSPDAKVRKLVDDLVSLRTAGIDQVPPLGFFASDFEQVRQLLSLKSFDEAVELVSRQSSPVPKDLEDPVRNARDRVQCRRQLEQALDSGDETALATFGQHPLLADYPKAADGVLKARQAPQVIPLIQQLDTAERAQEGRKLVQVWDGSQTLLAGRKSTQRFVGAVDRWRRRNSLCDDLLRQIRLPDPDGAPLKTALRELDSLGGHPDFTSHRKAAESFIERGDFLDRFLQAGASIDPATDARLESAWSEPHFGGWPRAESHRPRVQAATERLKRLAALKTAVAAASRPSLANEQSVVAAEQGLPPNYDPSHQARAKQARDAVAAVGKARQGLSRPNPSEEELALIAGELAASGAMPLLDPPDQLRLDLATRRLPLLQSLQIIPLTLPLDERDRSLLGLWDDVLLGQCPEAAPWRPAWQEAVDRKPLLAGLEQAIHDGDKSRIDEIVSNPLLANWPFDAQTQAAIQVAKSAVAGVRILVQALKTGRAAEIAERFDAPIVRANSSAFRPFQQALAAHVSSSLTTPDSIGLEPHKARASIHKAQGTSSRDRYHLRWKWPEFRFADACRVVLSTVRPDPGATPDTITAQRLVTSATVTRDQYQAAGGFWNVLVPTGAAAYVLVWAEIDLGFRKSWIGPLVLGRVPPPPTNP